MFLYFVEALAKTESDIAVATVPGSKIITSLPSSVPTVGISDNGRMSAPKLWKQVRELSKFDRCFPFDVIHAWSSRDWELGALLGKFMRRPVVATLHDHPCSGYISRKRRFLMRWTARYGLDRLVCVSNAVRQACRASGYPDDKLRVVHNGLAEPVSAQKPNRSTAIRLGYLGVLSKPKGLGVAFEVLDAISRRCAVEWEFHIAGGAQLVEAERFVKDIQSRYKTAPWWPRVWWHGWTDRPFDFVRSLDLLIFPSIMFDSFPNVLLEAGLAGIPVLASNVGGVSEIVRDRETGWLFDTAQIEDAGRLLADLISNPDQLRLTGQRANELIVSRFTMQAMISGYKRLYGELTATP